ncbi:MAG: MerR family transcriptional regulator [Spirochaetota bacterium]
MYQIGEFSKIFRVTPKTLRYYDEVGLLKPAKIDTHTGYRYYSSSQFPVMNSILSFRDMGFSLTDIQHLVSHPEDQNAYLERKILELKNQQKALLKQIRVSQTYKQTIQGAHNMQYYPTIKRLPNVIVASMRTTIPSYDAYFTIMPEMGQEMESQGAVCATPSYCFNIYHDAEYREENIDVECCEAVVQAKQDSDKVTYKTIEAVPQAACLLHQGPYTTLRDSYQFLYSWIEQSGYAVAGLPRESYIDGIWNKEDEAQWLTEIQIPVSPA